MQKKAILALASVGLLLKSCAPCPRDCGEVVVDTQYIHKYGITLPKHHWEETGQNGQVVKTLKEGVVCTQTYYMGQLDGESTYTFPFSENIEKVELYSQGQLIRQTFYYTTGRPRLEKIYNPPEHTVVKEWYENGSLKSSEKWAGSLLAKGDYYDNKQQRISGIDEGSGDRMDRDSHGMLIFSDRFQNGQVEYRYTYYPNSSPKEVTPYKNGIVEGIRKTYYPEGEPMTIGTWVDGRQEGTTVVFQEGQKVQEVPYHNGMKNGKGKVFKDGAIVIQELSWKDDQLHGCCKTFIEDRTITEWYYKGNQVTKGYYDSFNLKPDIETIQNRNG